MLIVERLLNSNYTAGKKKWVRYTRMRGFAKLATARLRRMGELHALGTAHLILWAVHSNRGTGDGRGSLDNGPSNLPGRRSPSISLFFLARLMSLWIYSAQLQTLWKHFKMPVWGVEEKRAQIMKLGRTARWWIGCCELARQSRGSFIAYGASSVIWI